MSSLAVDETLGVIPVNDISVVTDRPLHFPEKAVDSRPSISPFFELFFVTLVCT